MHRDVRARGGVRGRRQVVGVGLARHLEHGDGHRRRHFRTVREPLGVGPALQHGLGVGVALVGLFLHIVEGIEHQQRGLQRVASHGADFGVVEQLDQRGDVVAAEHGAQQFGGAGARDQRGLLRTQGHGGQVGGLDLGGIIHAGRHTVGDQVQQGLFLARRRVLDQFDQLGGLLGGQRQRGNAKRGAFGNMGAIGIKHGNLLVIGL
ncbi:hypothetical protein D3C87_1351410 [compost metagenome]